MTPKFTLRAAQSELGVEVFGGPHRITETGSIEFTVLTIAPQAAAADHTIVEIVNDPFPPRTGEPSNSVLDIALI